MTIIDRIDEFTIRKGHEKLDRDILALIKKVQADIKKIAKDSGDDPGKIEQWVIGKLIYALK